MKGGRDARSEWPSDSFAIGQDSMTAHGTTSGARAEQSTESAQPGVSILLVYDDIELCELLQEFFARRNIGLESVNDGRRGLARALGGGHDLLLLDVMMPGLDGFEVLRLVRRQSHVPVIMLTARTTQADRVAGLDAGADDYLPKPFGTEELMARIRAVLRRAARAPKEAEILEAGAIRLIPSAREVLAAGASVAVTTVEYDILEFLVHSAGRIVSRDELTAALYRRRGAQRHPPRSPGNRGRDRAGTAWGRGENQRA